MFCEYCGTQVADGVAFCPNCGAQMGAAAQAPAVQEPAPYGAQQPIQNYQQPYQQQAPVNPAAMAGMPNTTLAIVLIVIGFLCGILWGIIGVLQYKPMKDAIAMGDAVTAQKKFRIIAIATGIGVALNVLLVFSGALG